MSMLTGPNQTGIFTVSINPSMTTQGISQSTLSTVPSVQILPPPVQPVTQRQIPQLVTSGQVVNLTPVRTSPLESTKAHTCSFCQKNFSSRYNVSRHEKICKLNTNLNAGQQQVINHNNINNNTGKSFVCMFCQKNFQSQDTLNRHQKKCKSTTMVVQYQPPANQTSHTGKRRVHICKYCAKEFSTKWNVIRHEGIFHNPTDPIVVPQSAANGLALMPVPPPPGKPERYCRFCGNYFSSKYNAIRHEKICTRVPANSTNNQDPSNQHQQQQQQAVVETVQQQQSQQQVTSMPSSMQAQPPPLALATQQPQQNQHIQQIAQLQQHQLSQLQHQATLQPAQPNLQNVQQQLLPQQTMLLIEPHPTTPFHVCKFCNKQLTTRCDPVGHNILPNVPAVATITGQPMHLPIGSSGAQLTGLVTPVVASIPQVTLVPSQLQQQQAALTGQLIQAQVQQDKQSTQRQQDSGSQQQNSQPVQSGQQQINIQQQQHVQLQQHLQTQLQTNQQQHRLGENTQQVVQQQPDGQNSTERPHSCKYCEKHFATKWYLDQHEKIHTGEADMCKQCGKYFVTRWHLDKHMRVHMSGGANAKKAKKDVSPATTATILPPNGGVQITELAYAQQILVGADGIATIAGIRQIATSSGNTSGNQANDRTQSSRSNSVTFAQSADRTQYFIPNLDQNVSQAVSAPPPVTSQVTGHSEQQSTVDKSQIANSFNIM